MSAALSHPPTEAKTGHNSAAVLDPLDPEIITAQLEADYADMVERKKGLLAGVLRFIVKYGTTAKPCSDLPPSGLLGDIVYMGADLITPEFYRFVGKTWSKMEPEQVIRQLLVTLDIPDAEAAEKTTSFGSQIKANAKKWEGLRVPAKQPYDAAGKAVQSFFKAGQIDPLEEAAKGLEGCLTAFQRKQAKIEREAREAAAALLGAEAKAAWAAAQRTEHADMLETAEEAAVVADKAERRSHAPVADLARVTGSHGGTSAAVTVWSYEIRDEALITREYFLLDTARIAREVRALKNGFAVPGIKVVSDIKSSIR